MDFDLIDSLSPDNIEKLYDDMLNEDNRLAIWHVTLSGRCSDGRIVTSKGTVAPGFDGSAMLVGYCVSPTSNNNHFGARSFAPCGGEPTTVCVIESIEENPEDNTRVQLEVTCEDGTVSYPIGNVHTPGGAASLRATVGFCTYNSVSFGSFARPECNGDPAEVCVVDVLDDE